MSKLSSSAPSRWIYAPQAVLPCDDGSLHIGPAALEICGGRITQRLDAPPEGCIVERLGERELLSPAWINAHTHLAMACFRALSIEQATASNVVEDLFFKLESSMTADDVAAFARQGAYESLIHGVGMVWDHYYHAEAIAEAVASVGLSAVIAPTLQDVAGPGASSFEAHLAQTAAIATSESLADAGVFAALGPHATDTVSAKLWEQILDLACAHNLPVHLHVAQSVEEYERAQTLHQTSPVGLLERCGALERAPHIALIHGIYISDEDLAKLDPARHTLGFCPYSQLIFNFPAAVQHWQDAGIPWFVATDCAASNDDMSVQKELRYVAGLHLAKTSSSAQLERFMAQPSLATAQATHEHRQHGYAQRAPLATPAALLSRVWSTPGRMHPQLNVGELRVGALANLAVWDLDHPSFWPGTLPLRTLAMGDTSAALAKLMVVGRWFDQPATLAQSPEYKDATAEASRRLELLLARAGF